MTGLSRFTAWRRVVSALVLPLVVLVGMTIAPAAAYSAADTPEFSYKSQQDEVSANETCTGWWALVNSDGRTVGKTTWCNDGPNQNHFIICDLWGDPYSPAIVVDPEGAGPPDVIVYYDENGANDESCFRHNIGYQVRKWARGWTRHDNPQGSAYIKLPWMSPAGPF
ncbi:hypothetical protein ABGB14_11570 [Nonomuraea sp. B10E15]|uniref:hypothetical protein n=1 Tax=Nonomuraea sp. B10E15 TaxID=3153560 RepID=UPI00325C7721